MATQDETLPYKKQWIKRPLKLKDEKKYLLEVYGLTTLYEKCHGLDDKLVEHAIKHYDVDTCTTIVNGIKLKLQENSLARAFNLLQEQKPQDQSTVLELEINRLLKEDTKAYKQRRDKKQGISCARLPWPRIYKFIAEAVALKGSNSYISETLSSMFYGKLKHDHKINVAREIANNSQSQMLHVCRKGQKKVKCCHLFLGLYMKAL